MHGQPHIKLFFLSSRQFVGKLLVPSSGVAQSVVTRLRAGRPADRGFIPHSGRNYSLPDRVKQWWENCGPRFILKDTNKIVWNSMIIFSVLIRRYYSYILRVSDSETKWNCRATCKWDAKDITCVCSVHFALGFIVTVTRVTTDQVGLVSNFVRFCKINFK